VDEILRKLEAIEAKLDRMSRHIEFIRTHSGTYLGGGVALTHLIDERPMLVNSNDYGGPLLFISGGRYEDDNVEVLHSFIRDDTRTFVDAGANLGYFSLLVGARIRPYGKVFAFEPHPGLAELARRNAFINGLEPIITVYPFGLSDAEADTDFSFPKGHLGGGLIGNTELPERFDVVRSRVQRLDDVLDADVAVDLMKIDVEGHEPEVMRGMQQIMARSPQLKILFERLGMHVRLASQIEAVLQPFGFQIYGIAGDAQLSPLAPGGLASFSGYALAARPEQVDTLDRRRFSIYPSQLLVPGHPPLRPGDLLFSDGTAPQILFHGPYWFLRRGVWVLHIHGTIDGEIDVLLTERYGFATQSQRMSASLMQWRFHNEQHLILFEIVARAATPNARVEIERLELVRLA
jgi:FkbM family methyltransferase